MLLCDIGNTSYHFFDTITKIDYKESTKKFNPSKMVEKIYFICVHPMVKESLKNLVNWVDISSYINMEQYYKTMGIDRIVALEAITDGLIIDAGSAITVDVKTDGRFIGGFIYPGVTAMNNTYKNISKALEYPFNFNINLQNLPRDSQSAVSYGYLKLLYNEVISYNKNIILTGGDSDLFLKIFKDATIDKFLIFKGMQKIILETKSD